ncbi:glycosyltransferase [Myxococcota bacterium]|nr:glycosyltransferase [Myxococcota bacterium]MBU1413914.1 glycosyltransferase [Myxococcota bacterium]MBU1512396.1 glycosyltransferase [Myxococcota bacterium]
MTDSPTRRAALFSTNFLPFSQAFVYEELTHHERWEMEVFCHRRLNEEVFPFRHVHALSPAPSIQREIESVLYKTLTLSPSHYHRLKEGRFSLLHAQFGPGGVYALIYKKLLHLPLLVTFGGYEVPLLQTNRRFHPGFWRYWMTSGDLFQHIDRFLAVSSDLARRLVELGAPRERVHVFQRGIRIPPILSPNRSGSAWNIRILMAGRFVEKKGFEYGLQACDRLLRKGHDIRIQLIGEGPCDALYHRFVLDNRMSNRVIFRSPLPQAELRREMEESDLILIPSVVARNGDREGTTNVLKEAMAHGLPAVITRHGGNQDIIRDGVTGFIVDERDDAAMANRIERLIEDPGLRCRMGTAARNHAIESFSLRDRILELERHYDEVVEQFRGN